MKPIKDASHLYDVERRAYHAERPGFRISELQISPTQSVPWHCHMSIQDTFYVLEGNVRLFLREPKEEVRLNPGDTYSVRPSPVVPLRSPIAAAWNTSREAQPTLPAPPAASAWVTLLIRVIAYFSTR
jgi:hypothetical protein